MLAHEAAEPQVVGVVDDGFGSIHEAAATMAARRSQSSRSSAAPVNRSSNPPQARIALRSAAMLFDAKKRASAGSGLL